MFDISRINKTKYWPELLPGSDIYTQIPAGQQAAPPPLELRRFPGFAVELVDISLNSSADIEIEIRADKRQKRIVTSALDASKVYPYDFVASEFLGYSVYNVGTAPISNWRTMYGLWVYVPTVAEKLKRKWPLSAEEKEISDKLGIADSVEKGVLPLPKSIVLEREYQVLQSFTHARRITVPQDPNYETLMDIYTEAGDEFLVLAGFTCSNTDFANDIRLTISRDEDVDYITFRAPAIGNVGKVSCWIPALHEIKVDVTATVQVLNVDFTFDIFVCRLTNILRARWNLETGLPEETVNKVKGGVL